MKTRRLLALILAITVLASFILVPVFAEEAVPTLISAPVGDGYICEDLGILIGSGDEGVTEDYLDTLAKRTQAAMVNLRLLGLAETALAFEGEATFNDAADATEYWQPILEYLKANPGIGWVGDDNGNFNPNDYTTGRAFTKILLISLGYEYGLDFDWETTMDFAAEVGLTVLADKADDDLTVREIAAAIIEALGMTFNDATNISLISKLVADGVIDEAAAVAAGFEIDEPALVIVNAYASAVNEITVIMSTDVPDNTTILLKKGIAGFAFDGTIDGTTVTLTTLTTLPEGTYTVTVGDDTTEVEVVDQYATDLVINADSIYLAEGQDLEVALLDQYGNKMSLVGKNYSVFNQSSGYVYDPDVTTTIVVDVTDDTVGDGAEEGDVIFAFVYDPVSTLTISKELIVQAAPVLTEITIGEITLGEEDDDLLYEYTYDNVLDLEGIDQYGNVYELTLADFINGTVQYLVSNEACVDILRINVADGDLVFSTMEPGDVVFTFIIPAASYISSTEIVTIYAEPEVTTIQIAGPTEAVYAMEETTFPVVGYDQYGNVIDVDREEIDFNFTVDLDYAIGIAGTNEIGFICANDGQTTAYYFLNGMFQGTFDITVNPEAYPFQIVGLNDVPGALLTDTVIYFNDSQIEVIDQYGRPVKAAIMSGSGFDIIMWADEDVMNLAYDYSPDGGTEYAIGALPELEQGTDTFYLGLYNDDLKDVTPESIFAFDMQHVGVEDIDTYSLDVIDDLICSNDENWNNYDQEEFYFARILAQGAIRFGEDPFNEGPGGFEGLTPYSSPLVLRAYMEDGTQVGVYTFGSRKSQIDNLIDVFTFSIENTTLAPPMYYDYLTDPTVLSFDDVEGTCTAKAWVNGVAVAETTFEVSKAAPAVAGITAKADTYSIDELINLDVEDIYDMEEDYLTHMLFFMDFGYIEDVDFRDLGESILNSPFTVAILSRFEIVDQYGVELPWISLYNAGEIAIYDSEIETEDGLEIIITMMTTDGVYYDSLTITFPPRIQGDK